MHRRFFILLCVAVVSVAIARVDGPIVRIYPEKVIPAEPRVIERERVVEKVVNVPDGKQPDGYMTEDQCVQLPKGTEFRDLIWQYGWPAGADGHESYAGYLSYPLREDHDHYCQIDIWDSEVDGKTVSYP